MPRRPRVPALVHHQPTGQARVRLGGRDVYCGRYGTPEAEERYRRAVAEWLAARPPAAPAPAPAASAPGRRRQRAHPRLLAARAVSENRTFSTDWNSHVPGGGGIHNEGRWVTLVGTSFVANRSEAVGGGFASE